MNSQDLTTRLRGIGVLPIILPLSVEFVVATTASLVAGGASGVEIVIRTEHALPAIEACRKKFPDLLIGAGTVVTPELYDNAVNAGADFAISPSSSPDVDTHALGGPIVMIPGVQTPTEVSSAMRSGRTLLKFYPAEPAGINVLGDYGRVFPGAFFMPSLGIDEHNVESYLALQNVASAGGTWMYLGKDGPLSHSQIVHKMSASIALVERVRGSGDLGESSNAR